jgi:hypothetical protein
MKKLLKDGRKYTFSDYFELNNPTEEIVGAFGYSLSVAVINLPRSQAYDPAAIVNLQAAYYQIIPKVTLTSEIAKREFLIAPILMELVRATDSKISVEYPLDVDDQLGGSLDYLIRSDQELLVIEAKKGDLDKGFNQLAVELIALDRYEEPGSPAVLHGAVTIGEVWRFGILRRSDRHIVRDLHLYRVPEDLAQVFSILVGIVNYSPLATV